MPDKTSEQAEKIMDSEKKGANDDLDDQIAKMRQYQEVLSKKQGQEAAQLKAREDDIKKKEDDTSKISIDREWLQNMRSQNEKRETEMETMRKELQSYQNALKQHFNVDSAQALQEKLEEARKKREAEEESKLSRAEIAEKKSQKLERQLDEERIRFEQRERDLVASRDEIIIQNALMQAAIINGVVNPRQLLQLLKHEFIVDPVKKVPVYKAEEGFMSLEERVKIFLEDPDNWNLVQSRIPVGSSTQGTQGVGGKGPTFTKAELAKMRQERPQEYKERQPEILKAYQEGRVKP